MISKATRAIGPYIATIDQRRVHFEDGAKARDAVLVARRRGHHAIYHGRRDGGQ